jgi:RHS repeat-associated core domain
MNLMKTFARVMSIALLCTAMINNTMAAVVTYYHNDISGSPIAATDAAGNLKWKESYKPYGDKLTRSTASAGNDIGFHGKAHDDSTGLSYMGARYYDPVLGRFMGVDPVDFQASNLHSFNRYTYTNNNPYKFIDADGKYAELVLEAASVSIGTYSFQQNVNSGNYGAAAIDAAGVVVDTFLAVVPIVPGVVGFGVDTMRGGKAIDDLRAAATRAMADGPVTPISFPPRDTRRSANQIRAYTTPEEAQQALMSNGYNKAVSKDGTASMLTKGDKKYTFYEKSTSTNEPSAELKTLVKRDTKIRFAGER